MTRHEAFSEYSFAFWQPWSGERHRERQRQRELQERVGFLCTHCSLSLRMRLVKQMGTVLRPLWSGWKDESFQRVPEVLGFLLLLSGHQSLPVPVTADIHYLKDHIEINTQPRRPRHEVLSPKIDELGLKAAKSFDCWGINNHHASVKLGYQLFFFVNEFF